MSGQITVVLVFLLFKQVSAYEMRISDVSSDVCSSDLPAEGTALHAWAWHRDEAGELLPARLAGVELQNSFRPMIAVARFVEIGRESCRERVCQYVLISVVAVSLKN